MILILSLITIALIGGGVFAAIYFFDGGGGAGDGTGDGSGGTDGGGTGSGTGGGTGGGTTSSDPVSIIPDDAPETFDESEAEENGCNFTDSDGGFDIGIKGTCTTQKTLATE